MRILYLAEIRFPLERANGIQTFETCHALAERGHSVTLAVRPDTHQPARDPFAFYDRPPHQRLAIRCAPAVPQSLRRAAYTAFAVRLAAERRRYDVILTRDLGVCALLLRMPRASRQPAVYESHGYAPIVSRTLPHMLTAAPTPSEAKLARLAARERRVWQKAAGYVTITRALADELVARFGPRPNLAVVPDGVRLSPDRRFEPTPAADPAVVAYAGHLYPWKGVDVFIDALAHVPAVRGLIVGGHPGEGDLMRLQHRATALGIADRVTFVGLVPPAQVPAHLARAQALVLPNTATEISERYTSPLKLFEYLAAGRPIVASDLPSLREIVTHGADAWLVAPNDARALAEGLARVTSDRELAHRLAEAAWRRAADFSWARRAEQVEHVLVEAAGPADEST